MVYIACISPGDTISRFGFHIVDGWNWNKFSGKEVTIVAFTNCDSVRLYLNNHSLGSRNLNESKNAVLTWKVPFETGELKAEAYINGKIAAENILRTTGKPEKIILESDRPSIHGDGEDIASVKIFVTDKQGNIVPDTDNEITIRVTGAGINAGIGNGDSNNIEPYKSDHHSVFEGKARVYIQSNGKKGTIEIEASSKGLQSVV